MRFGGVVAVDALSFSAQASSITSLIGPNGAGKTTVFNCLTGFYRPSAGSIELNDGARALELTHMTGHSINSKGRVARTFQNVRLFGRMTVLENLLVAQHAALHRSWLVVVGGLWRSTAFVDAEYDAIEHAIFWLNQLGLEDRADEEAGSLPYGDQRRLEIARAMCTKPRLLCLDEPAAGLNPKESGDLARFLDQIRKAHGVAILLIEHDLSVVMDISDHIVVLDYGKKIAEGTPVQVQGDSAVIKAYLGSDDDEELDTAVAVGREHHAGAAEERQ